MHVCYCSSTYLPLQARLLLFVVYGIRTCISICMKRIRCSKLFCYCHNCDLMYTSLFLNLAGRRTSYTNMDDSGPISAILSSKTASAITCSTAYILAAILKQTYQT